MSDCCKIDPENLQKKRVLIWVLIINSVVFIVQFSAAIMADSSALLADSLDMLGDAITYSVSLYAASRGGRWLAKAALFKGGIISVFSFIIYIEVIYKLLYLQPLPKAGIMTIFSIIGLLSNGTCLYLLTRHRSKDINMYSTWICARNDIIGNLSVLLTAGLTVLTLSRWPDIIVGIGLATVLLFSAVKILKTSIRALNNNEH
jgi:Co/Zn/Cd efflux system component